jgi:YVTN family beta-propeller protein
MKLGRTHIGIASLLASANRISAVFAVACFIGSTPGHAQKAYIPSGENVQAVTVIDTTTDTVLATLPAGSIPTGVAVKPDGSKAYVTNDGESSTTVIDGVNNTVLKTITGTGGIGAAVSPDGTKVYTSGQITNTLSGVAVIDTTSDTVIATIPITAGESTVDAISPDGGTLYVATYVGNTGYVKISTASNTVTKTVSVGGGEQFGIQVSPDGSKLYLASYDCSCVSVISTANDTLITSIPLSQYVIGLALSLDGNNLYVTHGYNPTMVAVISTANNAVTTDIPLNCSNAACYNPGGLAITPDGSRLYVLSADGSTSGSSVTAVSTSTNQVVDNITQVPIGSPTGYGIFIALPTQVAVKPAPPSGTTCNGVYNGTFKGSITVSSGQNCQFISGGQITGNVAENGGNLSLNGASVGGSISISSGTFSLISDTIAGNVSIDDDAVNATNSICGSQINGTLQFDSNGTWVQIGSSSPTSCAGNKVGGNLEALGNTGSTFIFANTVVKNLTASNNTGPLDVVNNTVGGTLTCSGNTNLIMGGGNTAKKKVGQCN